MTPTNKTSTSASTTATDSAENIKPGIQLQSTEEKSILRLSTDLQSDLIRKLAEGASLQDMLNKVLDEVVAVLNADACAIYIDDALFGGDHTATMRAAKGYQAKAVGEAKCDILDPERVPPQPEKGKELGLTGWVISTGHSFLAQSPSDVTNHPHWSGKYDSDQLPGEIIQLAAFLAVPLRNPRGQVIGALKAERRQPGDPFSVKNQITLEALTRVSGHCITYVVEMANKDQVNAAITSWARDVIAEAVATEGELDAFLDIVVLTTAAATQADSCAVFLIDEDEDTGSEKKEKPKKIKKTRKTLTQRAGCGSQVLRRGIRSYMLPDDNQLADCMSMKICDPSTCSKKVAIPREERVGVTAWVAATRKPYHAKNLDELGKHCHHRGWYDKANYTGDEKCGAWLGVPLIVGGTIIGVLKVENVSRENVPDPRDFNTEIQQRFDVLAQDIALSIRRLQIQRPARYEIIQKAMPTIFEILKGEYDVRALVKKVVLETAKLFNARACALYLKEGNQLIQPDWAAVGYATHADKEHAKVRRFYDLVSPDQILDEPTPEHPKVGLTVWIAVTQEKFSAKSNLELISHPHHKGSYDKMNFEGDNKCESFMGVPLLIGEELVGVLKVETKQKQVGNQTEYAYFNEQDELVFELIANSAAIAIQNARLLESRRLADTIMNLPTANKVLAELYDFTRGREDVLSTLESTAQTIYDRDPFKADIIRNFAGILKPEFHLSILDQLARQLENPLNSLFTFLGMAARVDTIDQIINLSKKNLPVATLHNTEFAICTEKLSDTLGQVKDHLDRYVEDETLHIELEECLQLLGKAKNDIDEMDLFERIVLRRVFSRWDEIIEKKFDEYHDILSPYVAGNPLDAGSPVFFGREEIFRWITNNLNIRAQKNVMVLHGGWHTGKTSILRQLEDGPVGQHLRTRRQRPIFPIFVDFQQMPATGMVSFLLMLAENIESALSKYGIACPVPDEKEFEADYRAFTKFLKAIDHQLEERSRGLMLIMFDEFEKLEEYVFDERIDKEIFSYLRSIMQHQPSVTFILAGRHRLDEMSTTYRNLIFSVALHKQVGFFNQQEAEDLIRLPVKRSAVDYDDRVVKRIIKLTGGHPYFIQQLCDNCIDRLNQLKKGYHVTDAHLKYAVEEALRYNTLLDLFWEKETTEEDHKVLIALAKRSNGKKWATISELEAETGMAAATIHTTMQKLEKQQLIESEKSPERVPEKYRFAIDLLRLWVERKSI